MDASAKINPIKHFDPPRNFPTPALASSGQSPQSSPVVQETVMAFIFKIYEKLEAGTLDASEIERLKAEKRIDAITIEDRFLLMMKANFYGQAAYELNGMALVQMIPLLGDLSVDKLRKIHDDGRRYPGVGNNAQVVKVIEYIMAWKDDSDVGQINDSLHKRTIVLFVRDKFLKNYHTIIPNSAKPKFSAPNPNYSGRPLPDIKPKITKDPELVRQILIELLSGEGAYGAIATADSAIFSWGMGFAGKEGGLIQVLLRLWKDLKIARLFRNVGMEIDLNDEKIPKLNILEPTLFLNSQQ